MHPSCAGRCNDSATLNDSAGNDNFVGTYVYAAMYGDGFYNRVRLFEDVLAEATDGLDVAKFFDSPGHDNYVSTPTHNILYNDSYRSEARFFEGAHAYATSGGIDVAKFYDSPGDDDFLATPIYAAMFNNDLGFYNRAKFFEGVHAYATAGGDDLARFYDSPMNDDFLATPIYAALYNPTYRQEYTNGFYNRAKFFEGVHAFATAGGNDLARLYDSPADDTAYSDPMQSALWNDTYKEDYTDGFYNRAKYFEGVHSYATTGGYDIAYMHGSDESDTFYADPGQAALFNGTFEREYTQGFYNRTKAFEEVYAKAHEGDDDRALLYDSPEADLLEADGNWVRLSNEALDFLFEAAGFDHAKATTEDDKNEIDISEFAVLDFELEFEGPWRLRL